MEHLCIGSYVRVLTSCAATSERKFTPFCEKIMLSIAKDDETTLHYLPKHSKTEVTYSPTNFEKIQTSSQNIPTEIKEMATTKGARAIERYFKSKIITCFDPKRKEAAILALRKIICNDENIPPQTQLGFIRDLKKKDLRNMKSFVLSEFLTDIFLFSLLNTDNMLDSKFTMTIKKSHCENFINYSDSINLYEVEAPLTASSLPKTVKKNFGSVFSHVTSETLTISATHDLQIFALKFDDFGFDYNGLQKYLRSNIGHYLYSRARILQYIEDEDTESISYDAIAEMKKSISHLGLHPGDKLGEILLYIFLEEVLNAPKIMSEAELGNYGGISTSSSSGIHLLTFDTSPPSSQLVLGTSVIDGDLCKTIDESFAKAAILKKNKSGERRFVETHILPDSFPMDICKQLSEIILPSESHTNKPESSFGFFMGYSLRDVPRQRSSIGEYQSAVIKQIKNDIEQNLDKIENAVDRNGLTGYPLYIYLLPFTDAPRDKEQIMRTLLQIGEDTA